MSDLEAFWHNESIFVPELIRIAISHYQFETLHPFLDGNGRIGRLLITLYLVSKGLLRQPCLYVSAHLEQHRAAYYDALTAVRTRGDLAHWIRFFLVAINETAKKGVLTFQAIHQLRQITAAQVQTLGKRTANAQRVLDSLYIKPTVTSGGLAARLGVSQPTADRTIAELWKPSHATKRGRAGATCWPSLTLWASPSKGPCLPACCLAMAANIAPRC